MPAIRGVLEREPRQSVAMWPTEGDGDLQVSFDGRIDDRNDRIAELALPWKAGDAAIVAAAYHRWGDDFAAHLDGDFAVAIWDERRKRLVLARDCFGVRPLYVHTMAQTIAWSSRLGTLVESTACDRRPDPHFVGAFLTHGGRLDVSPYAAIAAVPPAGVMAFDRESQTTKTFWRLDPQTEIRLRSDQEYEEQFAALFHNAVRNRLRADGPVFVELSGGVDSSSILGVAHHVMKVRQRADSILQTISYVYDELALSDDRPFQAIAEVAFGRPAHHIEEWTAPLLSSIDHDYPYDAPSPLWAGAALYARAGEVLAEQGSNVLLSGVGGDHLCYSEVELPPSVADNLAALHLGRALRETKVWSAALATAQPKLLWSAARMAAAARWSIGERERRLPPWIDRRFARETAIDRPSRCAVDASAFRVPSRRQQFFVLRDMACEIAQRQCLDDGVEARYPFADRALVEFTNMIPIEQHLRPHETRSLQRRAMSAFLPAKIAHRTTKGGISKALYRAFRRCWPRIQTILDNPRVCEYGYVERARLADGLQRAAHGQNINAQALLRVLALEHWLRKLERPAAAIDRLQWPQSRAEGGETR